MRGRRGSRLSPPRSRLASERKGEQAKTAGAHLPRADELRAERQRARILDAMVEQSQDPLAYLDRDFNFIRVNRAYAEACRRTPESFVGRNHFELYPHAENQAIFERARATGERFFAPEKPFVFPDQPERGTTYWDWTLTPIKSEAGLVEGLVFSQRDVTEKVRARKRLEESEERFRLMADGVPDMIWVTDAQGDVRFANRHYRVFFGARCEQVEGSRWQPLLHPEDAAAYIDAFQSAVREQRPFLGEARARRADGAWRWIASRAEPRRSPTGEFLGHVGISSDVSERRWVEEALRRRTEELEAARRGAEIEKRRLEAVMQALPVGVAITDALGGNTQSNEAFEAIWRGPRPVTRSVADYAAYKAWWAETGEPVAPHEWASVQAVQRGEPVVGQLVEIARFDGSRAFVINSAAPVRDADGKVVGSAVSIQDVTELRRAQQALRESERIYRAIGESIDYGVWVCTPDGRNLYASESFLELVGLTREQCSDFGWSQVLHPDDAERTIAAWKECVRSGGNWDIEHRFRGVDGRWHPILARGVPVKDEKGEVLCWAGINLDIGQQKRTEEGLRQALAQAEGGRRTLEALMEYLPEGITVADAPDAATRMMSRVGRELLAGARADGTLEELEQRATFFEADGKTPLVPAERPLVRAVRRGETVRDRELVLVNAAGQRLTLRCSAAPIRGAQGEIVGGISGWTDISERKLQEERVAELTRLYAVLSRVNETIVRTREPQALYREVCRILAEEGGRTLVWLGLVQGQAVRPVAWSGEASEYIQGLRVETSGELSLGPTGTCIREGRPVVNDDFDTNPSTQPWRAAALRHGLRASAAFPLRHQGAVVGALTLYARQRGTFDSEQVRLLEALCADVSYALDAMSQERALRESERSSREADQRKNEFLAMLSHELRNPLAPIRNSLFILDRAAPGGEQARRAKAVIDRQVGQLVRLVDDLLDVTRINRGKIRIQRELVELSALLRRVVEDHRSLFEAAGLDLAMCAAPRPLRVRADPARIAQAVGNLLQNAAKFTGRGGSVTVSWDVDESGRRAAIRVRDTGVGIAPDALARLFRPFAQVESTLDRSRGGLGLGLALVKGLAELHGGTAQARSEGVGKGAEFTVLLPLDPNEAAAEVPASAPRVGRRRVLIIQGDADAVHSLRELLELAEHAVEVARDGLEGLQRARAFRPQVVLCDVGLSGMDGYDVARAFRADPALRSTHLVALTGHAQPEDLARAREAGFSDCLSKPPSLESLRRILVVDPAVSCAVSPGGEVREGAI